MDFGAVLGHERLSLLNGGSRDAWYAAGGPMESQRRQLPRSAYQARFAAPPTVVADKDYILARLGQPDVALLETRTAAELAWINAPRAAAIFQVRFI